MRLVARARIDGPFVGISSVSYGLSQVEILCKLIGCSVLESNRLERETQSENMHAKMLLANQNWFSSSLQKGC